MILALELTKRYAKAGNATSYPPGETPPVHKCTQDGWAYQAMLKIDRAAHPVRRPLPARRDLQREIEARLNVVEA
ncbi:hypothetical protein SAMN05444920_118115 [Nonomuraea solani]|uniref:Uncharacterized protein n=1 Tax=Nonomuraea solani TaxID=1144553 RepID=A0A1H6EV63_9ACTN|nr:hypothetical protein [Nonomuraea solani]SEH00926.1 hypothetical protein SAMN05444920_118115 [Nonomuraea solani]